MRLYLPRKRGFARWWESYVQCLRLQRWPISDPG